MTIAEAAPRPWRTDGSIIYDADGRIIFYAANLAFTAHRKQRRQLTAQGYANASLVVAAVNDLDQ